MVGFGEVKPPQDLHVLVLVAGNVGNQHQNMKFLGGPKALQASRVAVTA